MNSSNTDIYTDQKVANLNALLDSYASVSSPFKKKRLFLKMILFFAFILSFILGLLGGSNGNELLQIFGMILLASAVVVAIILAVISSLQKKKLSQIRKTIFSTFANRFIIDNSSIIFSNISFNYEQSIPSAFLGYTRMFSRISFGTVFNSFNLLQASYGDVPFLLSRFDLTHHDHENGSRRIMFGLWIVIDNNRNIDSEVCIMRKNTGLVDPKEVYETESTEFNRYFDVFADNSKNIPYILTPDLMQKMIEFRERYGTFSISYTAGRIMIFLDDADYFGFYLLSAALGHADGTLTDDKESTFYIDAQKVDQIARYELEKIATIINLALNRKI